MSAQATLGEVWLKEEGSDKDFFGGLIQVAVSLYHLTEENPKGAVQVFVKARDMLKPYPSTHHDLNLKKLLADLSDLFENKVDAQDRTVDYRNMVPRLEVQTEP